MIGLESLLDWIKELSHDTAFHRIIHAIQTELMIIGIVAFILRILTNLSVDQLVLNHEQHFALEFAEILVPFITFINCLWGVGFILFANRWTEMWSKTLRLTTVEVLNTYFDISENSIWYKITPNVFNEIIAKLEIKLYHNIFCEMFHLKRSAFAFDEYLRSVYEKFALDIVLVTIYDWYYILYTIYYILYTIHYILYTIYYILYTIYYILYTI